MDNTDTSGATGPGLPKNTPFSPVGSERPMPGGARPAGGAAPASAPNTALVEPKVAAVAEQNDRTGVFGKLVKDDADIAGLVAYSIYKQNKLDWLRAFESAKGRAPQDSELESYIVGEGTPRRLATYRHLAQATLAGNGPEVDGVARPGRAPLGGRRFDTGTLTTGLMVTYGLIAVLFLIIFWFAAHFTSR